MCISWDFRPNFPNIWIQCHLKLIKNCTQWVSHSFSIIKIKSEITWPSITKKLGEEEKVPKVVQSWHSLDQADKKPEWYKWLFYSVHHHQLRKQPVYVLLIPASCHYNKKLAYCKKHHVYHKNIHWSQSVESTWYHHLWHVWPRPATVNGRTNCQGLGMQTTSRQCCVVHMLLTVTCSSFGW